MINAIRCKTDRLEILRIRLKQYRKHNLQIKLKFCMIHRIADKKLHNVI